MDVRPRVPQSAVMLGTDWESSQSSGKKRRREGCNCNSCARRGDNPKKATVDVTFRGACCEGTCLAGDVFSWCEKRGKFITICSGCYKVILPLTPDDEPWCLSKNERAEALAANKTPRDIAAMNKEREADRRAMLQDLKTAQDGPSEQS